MADTISVMVVDDSAVVRETLSQILNADPDIEVTATAADPYIAARKLQTMIPDVITLDIEMPRMDGLSFLQKLMQEHPIPVIICSSKAEHGSDNALRALEFGAVEIIEKPKVGTREFLEEAKTRVTDAVRAAHLAKLEKLKPKPKSAHTHVIPKLNADAVLPKARPHVVVETTETVIVVGASTGGTEALRAFLEAMPLDAPPIVIVQHMPENFTAAFARRLDTLCRMTVKEAETGDSLIRGRALIAPGNRHCLLKRSGARYYVEIKDGPLVSRHRPSVDVLFRSAARYAGRNAVGIIMTGMGDDGARGMLEMKDAGAYTVAQDEATSVVYGMPNEAVKRGGVEISLPLPDIAEHVLVRASERRR
ncbi:MAG: chemotaxis response regulator protein-glutamate methylesterase [Spirochaetaceae bacterium]